MAKGVAHSKKVIADMQSLCLDGIELVQHYSLFHAMGKIGSIVSNVKDLIEQSKEALPELKDLNAQEAGELASAAYTMVRAIVSKLQLPSAVSA